MKSAALIVAACLSSSAFAFDLASEAANGYSRLRVNSLQVNCRGDGTCASIFGAAGSPYPPVPGTGDVVRAVVPRPNDLNNPAAGSLDHFDLAKSGSEVRFALHDIGIGYDIGFTLAASPVGSGLIKMEGFTPQSGYCVALEPNELVGMKIIRFSGAGANVCARVAQQAAPTDDSDGLRHYKSFAMTNDPGCAPSDPSLAAVSSSRENFFSVEYYLNNPDPNTMDQAEFLDRMAAERLRVQQLNDERTALCAPLDPAVRAMRADCQPIPFLGVVYALTPEQCAVYDHRGDFNRITGSFEAFGGTLASAPASTADSFPRPQTEVHLDGNGVCRLLSDGTVPPVSMTGQVIVTQPRGTAYSSDEDYELGQLSRGVDWTLYAFSAGVSVAGLTYSPTYGHVELAAGTSARIPFTMTVYNVDRHPEFTGTLSIEARSRQPIDVRPALLPVMATTEMGLCEQLDPMLTSIWEDLGFALPWGMDDPAPDVFTTLAQEITAKLWSWIAPKTDPVKQTAPKK